MKNKQALRVFKAIIKDKEKQEKTKMVQEVADDKMAEGKDTTKYKKDKAIKGKGAIDWKENKVSMLIELLEEIRSLWDVLTNIIQNVMLKIQHIKK